MTKTTNKEILAGRINAACEATPPRTKTRRDALAQIRWVLRDQNGNYAALGDPSGPLGAQIQAVADIKDALVFDGRDNEDVKRRFYESLTGMTYEIEMLRA